MYPTDKYDMMKFTQFNISEINSSMFNTGNINYKLTDVELINMYCSWFNDYVPDIMIKTGIVLIILLFIVCLLYVLKQYTLRSLISNISDVVVYSIFMYLFAISYISRYGYQAMINLIYIILPLFIFLGGYYIYHLIKESREG